ncbi:MAG: AraC family transcriptional regulator [Candidatus Borkfalkiaceae bacterium]|nr:AraC family transcriptional regulator [Clostridia bacterium]MDY6224082.1 AraC family transcriptional regulator [Christensenellaceae bacterium]
MQDYIETHAEEEITLAALSAQAMFSPWHAYRLFCLYTGYTPAAYVRRLRLARAAKKLKCGNCRVIDAAFDCGFGSADGFTRAFFKEFGVTPIEYARNPVPVSLFVPYGAKYKELKKENKAMKEAKTVFVRAVKKLQRKAIIKRGVKADEYFSYCEEVGCDVWGLLLSMDSLCGEPVCMYLPQSMIKPGTSLYVQGVETEKNYAGRVPAGFDVIELPEAEYLEFKGEPFEEEEYEEAIFQVKKAMDKFNPEPMGYVWDESNPRIQLEPRGERGYIELKAVKKI